MKNVTINSRIFQKKRIDFIRFLVCMPATKAQAATGTMRQVRQHTASISTWQAGAIRAVRPRRATGENFPAGL
jgi:hypothetical protein